MNKKIITLFLLTPTILLAGCQLGWDHRGGSVTPSSEPSSEQPSSSSEEVDTYRVSQEKFRNLITYLDAVTTNANFTARIEFESENEEEFKSSALILENDGGKYHMTIENDPDYNMYMVFNPNTLDRENYTVSEKEYNWKKSSGSWETSTNTSLDYSFVFMFLGFPYRYFRYDRFTYNEAEHNYTNPIAVITIDDTSLDCRNITLQFHNEVLMYSELSIAELGHYKTTFTKIGETTVTPPSV